MQGMQGEYPRYHASDISLQKQKPQPIPFDTRTLDALSLGGPLSNGEEI